MEKLVFKIDEISEEGLELELLPDPSLYGISDVAVVNPPGLSGWIRIARDRSDLMVKGEVCAVIEIPCNRCLGPVVTSVGGEFFFRMVQRKGVPEKEEIELDEGELDVEFLEGDEVDIRRIIAEQIYLNVPMRVTCQSDCRGLCSTCGANLNNGDCGHGGEKTDPRWDALKKIKSNN